MEGLGGRLKKLRKIKGITQSQMADYLSINSVTYSDYEREKINPDLRKILLLADFFSVTTDFLLGVTNDDVHPMSENPKNEQIQKSTPKYTPNNTPNEQINKPNTHYGSTDQSSVMMEIITSQRQLIEHLSAQIKELKDNKGK